MSRTIEDRLAARARKAYAHATSRRAEAESAKARQRLDRAWRGARRAYLERLTLADIAAASDVDA